MKTTIHLIIALFVLNANAVELKCNAFLFGDGKDLNANLISQPTAAVSLLGANLDGINFLVLVTDDLQVSFEKPQADGYNTTIIAATTLPIPTKVNQRFSVMSTFENRELRINCYNK